MPRARPAPSPAVPEILPLTPARFPDLERLFRAGGDCANCWCMWWKLSRAECDAGLGEGHRRALEAIVRGGVVPGLLAYVGGEPAGWVAVEPREAFPRVYRSRLLRPAKGEDAPGTWAITCFVVGSGHRGRGLTGKLVAAAAAYARGGGARAVEAYPVVRARGGGDAAAYHGTVGTFERAGFEVVARPSETRAIVRKRLGRGRPGPVRAPRRTAAARAGR